MRPLLILCALKAIRHISKRPLRDYIIYLVVLCFPHQIASGEKLMLIMNVVVTAVIDSSGMEMILLITMQ